MQQQQRKQGRPAPRLDFRRSPESVLCSPSLAQRRGWVRGGSPIGFFNPLIPTQNFVQSRNPDSYFWYPTSFLNLAAILHQNPESRALIERNPGSRKTYWGPSTGSCSRTAAGNPAYFSYHQSAWSWNGYWFPDSSKEYWIPLKIGMVKIYPTVMKDNDWSLSSSPSIF